MTKKPKKATLRGINRRLKGHGIELVKGKGYFYFADLPEGGYPLEDLDSTSVMLPRLGLQSEDEWVRDGLELIDASRDVRNLMYQEDANPYAQEEYEVPDYGPFSFGPRNRTISSFPGGDTIVVENAIRYGFASPMDMAVVYLQQEGVTKDMMMGIPPSSYKRWDSHFSGTTFSLSDFLPTELMQIYDGLPGEYPGTDVHGKYPHETWEEWRQREYGDAAPTFGKIKENPLGDAGGNVGWCPKCGADEDHPTDKNAALVRLFKYYDKEGRVWSQCLICSGGYGGDATTPGKFDKTKHDPKKGWFAENPSGECYSWAISPTHLGGIR